MRDNNDENIALALQRKTADNGSSIRLQKGKPGNIQY